MHDKVKRFIWARAAENMRPCEIFKMIEAGVPELKDVQPIDRPSRKTVEREVKKARVDDTSDAWSLRDEDGDNARLILDVLADVVVATEGRKRSFTKKEASWVLRLRKVAPDASPYNVWKVAREYMGLESKKVADTAKLDHYLAFRPWTNLNRFGNYEQAVALGWVEEEPLRLWDTEDRLYSDTELFSNMARSLVETRPFVLNAAYRWFKDREPARRELEKKLSLLKERSPESYEKVVRAGEKAHRLSIEYFRSWGKRSNLEVTPEDEKELQSIWAEYGGLLSSLGDSQ